MFFGRYCYWWIMNYRLSPLLFLNRSGGLRDRTYPQYIFFGIENTAACCDYFFWFLFWRGKIPSGLICIPRRYQKRYISRYIFTALCLYISRIHIRIYIYIYTCGGHGRSTRNNSSFRANKCLVYLVVNLRGVSLLCVLYSRARFYIMARNVVLWFYTYITVNTADVTIKHLVVPYPVALVYWSWSDEYFGSRRHKKTKRTPTTNGFRNGPEKITPNSPYTDF